MQLFFLKEKKWILKKHTKHPYFKGPEIIFTYTGLRGTAGASRTEKDLSKGRFPSGHTDFFSLIL
jgi:hypothetical protein